jgi:GDP-L-fucose synthase
MRKLTDVSKLNSLGWFHKTELEDGIKEIFNWYINKDK